LGFLSKFVWFILLLVLFVISIQSGLGITGAVVIDGLVSLVIVYLNGLRSLRKARDLGRARVSVDSMSLGRFLGLLLIVALAAIIFSPSVIGFPKNNGTTTIVNSTTSPLDSSRNGTSLFFKSLRGAGYTVILTNSSLDLDRELDKRGPAALFLIGADRAFSGRESGDPRRPSNLDLLRQRYEEGTMSFLIAEGNQTDNNTLLQMFSASIFGSAIIEPTSRFRNKEVFIVNATVGLENIPVIFDVASPIALPHPISAVVNGDRTIDVYPADSLKASGRTSNSSYDTFSHVPGQRTVLATGQSQNARAALISDSGPFTNLDYNSTAKVPNSNSTVGETESRFASKLTDWVMRSDKSVRIIYDNSHYGDSSVISDANTRGLKVGPLFTSLLEQYISYTGNLYDNFVSDLGPYWGAIFGLFLASAMYGSLTQWYASEARGRDDQPVPPVEKSIVAQSPGRLDFLRIIRDKGYYVARLGQLYITLGDLLERELGTPIDTVTSEQLSSRVGLEEAIRAENMLVRLSKIHEYALGKRRFLFPPVLLWKRSTRKRFEEVEDFLNKLGLTLTGEGDSRSMLEYRLRR